MSKKFKLVDDGKYGEFGAIENTREGATTPCRNCGAMNHLSMIVSMGECYECDEPMSLYIGIEE